MGRSKQLIKIDDEELLFQAARASINSKTETIVVLGSNAQEHKTVITDLPVDIITNHGWNDGIGSSIKTGIRYALEKYPDLQSIIIMVCDQPFVTSDYLKKIKSIAASSAEWIVASGYSGIKGVPALFKKPVFNDLLNISSESGARKVIENHSDQTITVEFPDGSVDIDTQEDLNNFTRR